jgi:hypothetical protein
MSIVLLGSTSGSCTLQEQAVAGTTTLTLPTFNGTVGLLVSGTAVVASGTSVDFTGIPAGVRRITVMFSTVSTSGTSALIVQLGDSGGIEATGYNDTLGCIATSTASVANATTGFAVASFGANTDAASGSVILTLISGNAWTLNGVVRVTNSRVCYAAGSKGLTDTLTQLRVTTFNGTDTFDAGSINILYE